MKNSLILEGGNAVQGVDRIPSGFINDTVEKFTEEAILAAFPELSKEDIFLTGSTGKKPDSGDIDICIDIRKLKKSVFECLLLFNEYCVKNLSLESYINTFVMNIVHIKYPQIGSDGKFVQIDAMLTKNPEFVKFSSCGDVSSTKYKLAHRNILFNAILFGISSNVEVYDDDGKPLKWTALNIESTGIFNEQLTLIDKNGDLLMYEGKPYEFSAAEKIRRTPYITEVDKAMKLMFGNKIKPEDVDNFEKAFAVVSSSNFKYRMLFKDIIGYCIVSFKSSSKLEMPVELEQFL